MNKIITIVLAILFISACKDNNVNNPISNAILTDTLASKVSVYNNDGKLLACMYFDGIRSISYKERMHYNLYGASSMPNYFGFEFSDLSYNYVNVNFFEKLGCPTKIIDSGVETNFLYDANGYLIRVTTNNPYMNKDYSINYNLNGNKIIDFDATADWINGFCQRKYYYNSSGLINRINFIIDGKYLGYSEYFYNNNLLIERDFFDTLANETGKLTYEYNSQNLLIKETSYTTTNKISSYTDYTYQNNLLTECIETFMDSQHDYHDWSSKSPRSFSYNANGLLIAEPLWQSTDNTNVYVYKYE